MTASRRTLLTGAAFAALSIGLKLLIVGYGLPHEFNPDEPYILKDPLKLTLLYKSGDFRAPTYLYFWVLQIWYALVFLAGRVFSQWHSFGEFQNLIVGESPKILLAGRLLAVGCSGAAVWILYSVLASTIDDARLRWLTGATLAMNPIDLVSSMWLKFDGPALLMNAFVVAALVRYLNGHDAKARRRLYLLAFIACSFRIDFAVVLAVVAVYDFAVGQPFRPVLPAVSAGAALYCAITLMPVAVLSRHFAASGSAPVLLVSNTFEQNISSKIANQTLADVARSVGSNLVSYGLILLLALGPALFIALRAIAGDNVLAGMALLLFAGLLAPAVVFPAGGTRYVLLPSIYLLLAAAWALQRLRQMAARYVLMGLTVLFAGSLFIETITAIRGQSDPRIAAGQYLLAHSRPDEPIAIENYINQGLHAELDECPDELALKAEATRQAKLGSGETYEFRAQQRPPVCRRILEVNDTDRFARSSFVGRWSNTYNAASLPAWFSSNTQYESAVPSVHQAFARSVSERYDVAAIFEPRYADPRLHVLLAGTPFYVKVFVYRRRSS